MARARADHDNMSQAELARRVGVIIGDTVSQAMISKIENAETSTSSTLILPICQVLDIPVPQHFTDERDRAWYHLGHFLRHADPDGYKLELARLEHQAKRLREQQEGAPATKEPDDPRK